MRLTTSHDRLAAPVEPSTFWVSGLAIGTLLSVSALERATGAAPVQHLYYVPIIIAGLGFRMPGGVISALAAIVLYHVANPHLLTFRYGESDLVLENQRTAVEIATGRLTASVLLVKALGGGWSTADLPTAQMLK